MTLLQLSGGAGPLDHIVLPHKADIAIYFGVLRVFSAVLRKTRRRQNAQLFLRTARMFLRTLRP